eukprot:1138149-Pelagomonas_calceolata.AAC.1
MPSWYPHCWDFTALRASASPSPSLISRSNVSHLLGMMKRVLQFLTLLAKFLESFHLHAHPGSVFTVCGGSSRSRSRINQQQEQCSGTGRRPASGRPSSCAVDPGAFPVQQEQCCLLFVKRSALTVKIWASPARECNRLSAKENASTSDRASSTCQ